MEIILKLDLQKAQNVMSTQINKRENYIFIKY